MKIFYTTPIVQGMDMPETRSALSISGVECHVHIGWPEHERFQRQIITVDMHLKFATHPAAVYTDDLQDTVCYATLIQRLHQFLRGKHFRLIEHFTQAIHAEIKTLVPDQTKVRIYAMKRPPISDFGGEVRFEYGED